MQCAGSSVRATCPTSPISTAFGKLDSSTWEGATDDRHATVFYVPRSLAPAVY